MEEKRVATTGTGTFLDTAIQNIEDMKVAAQMILDSKLAPDHFYEKNEKGKPDYNKGNVASVILVCAHGHDLGLKPLVALQHVIPVNGLLSIKGDAAKTLIFKSGKLEPGSFKENISGSLADETYEVAITAKRVDTQETMTRTFGVAQAKRAGLWVTQKMINGQDGWKYLKSAWYKYPERMMTYRALGFLARDLFPDVLSGSYTTEEAMDIPQDTTVVVATTNGPEVIIPDKQHGEARSENLTNKATEQIDKRAGDLEPKPKTSDTDKQPMTYAEATPASFEGEETRPQNDPDPDPSPSTGRASKSTMLNGTPGFIGVYTEEELKVMDSKDLNSLIECDSMMVSTREIDPGKNTNKKLRTILLSFYAGDIVVLYAKFDPEDEIGNAQKASAAAGTTIHDIVAATEPTDEIPMEPVGEDPDQGTYEAGVEAQVTEDPSSEPDPHDDVNKFNIDVPDLVEGKRSFEQVKTLYEELSNVAGIDNKAFESLVTTKFPQFQHYRMKEDFCYKATTAEVNSLLNSI